MASRDIDPESPGDLVHDRSYGARLLKKVRTGVNVLLSRTRDPSPDGQDESIFSLTDPRRHCKIESFRRDRIYEMSGGRSPGPSKRNHKETLNRETHKTGEKRKSLPRSRPESMDSRTQGGTSRRRHQANYASLSKELEERRAAEVMPPLEARRRGPRHQLNYDSICKELEKMNPHEPMYLPQPRKKNKYHPVEDEDHDEESIATDMAISGSPSKGQQIDARRRKDLSPPESLDSFSGPCLPQPIGRALSPTPKQRRRISAPDGTNGDGKRQSSLNTDSYKSSRLTPTRIPRAAPKTLEPQHDATDQKSKQQEKDEVQETTPLGMLTGTYKVAKERNAVRARRASVAGQADKWRNDERRKYWKIED